LSAAIEALVRLWPIAQRDHGGAGVVCRFLLGLYNGTRFPFNLTELRRLDTDTLGDVMLVLQMDATFCTREVHELLNQALGRRDIGPQLELLAYNRRLKGAIKKTDLDYVRERIAYLNLPTDPVSSGAVRQAAVTA